MYFRKGGWVYIISNARRTVLYTGVTSNIVQRMLRHRSKYYPNSFSAQYNLNKLLYYKFFDTITEAISVEKYIKGKSRKYKLDLIIKSNPSMNDISCELDDLDMF